MELTFSAFQLLINKKIPTLEIFRSLIDEERYRNLGNYYRLEIEIVEDRFFWLYARYGKPFPYSNEVVDIDTEETKENPKSENDIELNQQLFCLFDNIKKTLFISNSNKKSFLEAFLKDKLQQETVIKRHFLSPEQFIEKIRTIDTISFTSENNLFKPENGIFNASKNMFGLGEPIDFKIDLNYNGQSKTEKFMKTFLSLNEKRINQEIKTLICIGKDDSDMETMFDINSFTQVISIKVKRNKGMYEQTLVKDNLLLEIKKKEN